VAKRPAGEGMIRQRPGGLWEARVRQNGRQVSIYGKSQKEVRDKLQGLRADASEGRPIVASKLTVGEFLDRWLEDVVRVKNAPKTIVDYEMHVRVHIAPEFGRTLLKSLSGPDIQRWVNKLAKEHSPRSVQYYRSTFRIALNQAVKWKLIAHNPVLATELPTQRKREIEAMEAETARAILAAFEGHELEALVTLLLATGVRPGEALGLRWSDIDFNTGVMRIQTARSGQLKRESARRTLVMPEVVIWQLHDRPRFSVLVFPTRTGGLRDGTTTLHQFQKRLAEKGLPKMTLHELRHGHATLQLTEGASLREIMEQLGHTQISTTANLYAHVAPELRRKAAERMNKLFGT
jgi:integrase